MSHYYDLKCLDCSEPHEKAQDRYHVGYAGFDNANRGHKELLAMLMLRPEFEALGLAHKRLRAAPEKLPEYTSLDSGPMLDAIPRAAWFFADHVGHLVVVASEYWHDAFFGCLKDVDEEYKRDSGLRENVRECRLDFNHDGPCSRTRPDGK